MPHGGPGDPMKSEDQISKMMAFLQEQEMMKRQFEIQMFSKNHRGNAEICTFGSLSLCDPQNVPILSLNVGSHTNPVEKIVNNALLFY